MDKMTRQGRQDSQVRELGRHAYGYGRLLGYVYHAIAVHVGGGMEPGGQQSRPQCIPEHEDSTGTGSGRTVQPQFDHHHFQLRVL